MDQNMTAADAHSIANGAGQYPDRMNDNDRTAGSVGIDFVNRIDSLTTYCKSDEIGGVKPADAFNRVDYAGDKNVTRMQDVEYSAAEMPTLGK